jgi:hypothetical protein
MTQKGYIFIQLSSRELNYKLRVICVPQILGFYHGALKKTTDFEEKHICLCVARSKMHESSPIFHKKELRNYL